MMWKIHIYTFGSSELLTNMLQQQLLYVVVHS